MELTNWQELLENRYKELSVQRNQSSTRQIFGLEHGLDLSEIQSLSTVIRNQIAVGKPKDEHFLAWIVYATEIGYRYSGDEYWQTFEQETPGWNIYGDRYWIRQCYHRFQNEFNGVVPTGLWANHFSIICWPITHSIIPQDLQKQLVRILYDIRNLYSSDLLKSPIELGGVIASRSWNASTRFQNLAQETLLIGQIATALLLQGDFGSENIILPSTLKRISGDLDRERLTGELIHSARQKARDSTQIRSLGALGHAGKSPYPSQKEDVLREIEDLDIKPNLILRPKTLTDDSWEIILEIPNLSQMIYRYPHTREVLMNSRCTIAGVNGRPLARGRFLYNSQQFNLSRWPHNDEVLLQFENTSPQLEQLFRSEYLLGSNPIKLFKITSDRLATECFGLRVRPGVKYLFISTNKPLIKDCNIKPIILSCDDVCGAILDIPLSISSDWERTIQILGLGFLRTIDVWPAGLDASSWDDDGHGMWTVSEKPCIGICADHKLSILNVSISNHENLAIELSSISPNEPVFIELPRLSIGTYVVSISTKSCSADRIVESNIFNLVIKIREVNARSSGLKISSPLLFHIHPITPNLEQLLEGLVDVTILGPYGRRVGCKITLFESNNPKAIYSKSLPPMPLPITSEGWRMHFKKSVLSSKDLGKSFDLARVCKLEFSAEELGSYEIYCEREFVSFRWIVAHRGQKYLISLIDDTGDKETSSVTLYSFDKPCIDTKINITSRYEVPNFGGLFVAQKKDLTASIVVPPMVLHDFSDLDCDPYIENVQRNVEPIKLMLCISYQWGLARISGSFLSTQRREKVLLAIAHHVASAICGSNWAIAENDYSKNHNLTLLIGTISKHHEVVTACGDLLNAIATSEFLSCKTWVQLLSKLTKKFNLLSLNSPQEDDYYEWITEFALRLASDPQNVKAWAREGINNGLKCLIELPTLLKIARLIVIATDYYNKSKFEYIELYAGWAWQ